MLNLGIVGAENSHSWQIGKTCNIDKAVSMRVTLLWGEASKFAKEAAEKGNIPEIVKDWRDMLGRVDGVMIDHRHPGPHFEPAKFFVENKVPLFVDKPFTYSLRKAKQLLDLAAKKKTPITTFSNLAIQQSFAGLKKAVAKLGKTQAVNSHGPVDIKSKYGGIFFYGIHQIDTLVELLGTDAKSAFLQKQGANGVATILFKSGAVATVNCIKENAGGFHWRVCGEKGMICHDHVPDKNSYLVSAKLIRKLLSTGKTPFSRERMLAPIAILEALDKSLKTGKPANVAKF